MSGGFQDKRGDVSVCPGISALEHGLRLSSRVDALSHRSDCDGIQLEGEKALGVRRVTQSGEM